MDERVRVWRVSGYEGRISQISTTQSGQHLRFQTSSADTAAAHPPNMLRVWVLCAGQSWMMPASCVCPPHNLPSSGPSQHARGAGRGKPRRPLRISAAPTRRGTLGSGCASRASGRGWRHRRVDAGGGSCAGESALVSGPF
eukprot:354321-Chlamydomonas_euryale.AAC.9